MSYRAIIFYMLIIQSARRLHLFLSVLLHGDESGGGPNKRENYAKVSAILNSIKCSEDAVDSTKSKVGYLVVNHCQYLLC